jgi:Ca2+-binding RTX toxin-like protein
MTAIHNESLLILIILGVVLLNSMPSNVEAYFKAPEIISVSLEEESSEDGSREEESSEDGSREEESSEDGSREEESSEDGSREPEDRRRPFNEVCKRGGSDTNGNGYYDSGEPCAGTKTGIETINRNTPVLPPSTEQGSNNSPQDEERTNERSGTRVDSNRFQNSNLDGTYGNDYIDGTPAGDTVVGLAGADIIDGGAGNDIIRAGSGDDELIGGRGSDSLTGGGGRDHFICGSGVDSITDYSVRLDKKTADCEDF